MARFPLLLGLAFACALTSAPALAGPREGAALTAAANASGRPKECSGPASSGQRGWRPTIWDNARQPQLKRYCDLLGRAQARLSQAPVAAREAATVADRILPGYASPWVIMGRAEVALHRFDDALKAFEKARSIDVRSIEEPHALHDLGLAQRHAGKLPEALETYRTLVPRLGLLSGVQDRAGVLLEAAAIAMAGGDDGQREAITLLSEARSYPASRYDPDVYALLALALDRSGSSEQASEMLEVMRARGLALAAPDPEAPPAYLVRTGDAAAMYAISLERTDPKKAAELWEKFASSETNQRFKDHAKKRVEAARAAAAKKPRVVAPPAPAPGKPK
jgi:tetratricopeptide (TPR) repeat protein